MWYFHNITIHAVNVSLNERLPPSFMGCIGECMVIIQRNCGAMSTEVRSTEVDIAPQF